MPTLAEAQDEHTTALRAWLLARGDDEPPALARLDQARAALREAFAARVRGTTHRRWGRPETW